ncbi:3,4-dihydroxy-2-butanone-4-phosphate synthase [Moheibacter stercoris]|uniref:3,4-dihydroxy-2-butanone-4-phosphate synthase n=1 Tax=Moheibacter stercoris TaxID=1628251 RepID=UPI003F496D4E
METSTQTFKLNTISEALEEIRQGKVIIVVDDEDRENEGDFVAAAEMVTPEMINFMALHGRGLICTPLTIDRCKELNLDLMVTNNTVLHETQFTVSVDFKGKGNTTGISVQDRANTIEALIDPATKPEDLGRPGHIFPLRAKNGGVLHRAGHTEAAVDLARLAGLQPAGILVEILNDDGSMARLPELIKIAEKFDLKIITIQDLIAYRLQHDSLIDRVEEFPVKTAFGDFNLVSYKQTTNNQIHYVLKTGEWTEDEVVPLRVISSNSYYDLFAALEFGETPQLKITSDIIQNHGKGAIIFINNVSDSDLMLTKMNRFRQYLEGKVDSGIIPNDMKDYGIGAQIIKDLGIKKINLITRKPQNQQSSVGGYGIDIVEYTAVN